MRTKDNILLEQAYAKVLEANELSLNKQKPNKDPEVLKQMSDYLLNSAVYFASVHGLVYGEQDWSREKSKSIQLTNGPLNSILEQAPQTVKELANQGYDWTRIFISTDKVHDFHDIIQQQQPRRAQLTDITNTITLIHNSNHILIRVYDPFGFKPSKELKVDKSSVPGALLKSESLLASLYGVQQ